MTLNRACLRGYTVMHVIIWTRENSQRYALTAPRENLHSILTEGNSGHTVNSYWCICLTMCRLSLKVSRFVNQVSFNKTKVNRRLGLGDVLYPALLYDRCLIKPVLDDRTECRPSFRVVHYAPIEPRTLYLATACMGITHDIIISSMFTSHLFLQTGDLWDFREGFIVQRNVIYMGI